MRSLALLRTGTPAELAVVDDLPRPSCGNGLHVMNWTGLRGAVAIALALSLPADVPDRTLLQGTTFGIVLFTVIVQGATAERVMRWARPTSDPVPVAGVEALVRSTHAGVSLDARRLPGDPRLSNVDALEDAKPGGHADQGGAAMGHER